MIEPSPPVSKAPPVTTAMIASNFFKRPRSAPAEPNSITWQVAKTAAQQAVNTSIRIFTRLTGTPT